MDFDASKETVGNIVENPNLVQGLYRHICESPNIEYMNNRSVTSLDLPRVEVTSLKDGQHDIAWDSVFHLAKLTLNDGSQIETRLVVRED